VTLSWLIVVFDCKKILVCYRGSKCELVVPSFTKGKLQLSAKDAQLTRAMSRDWIHVKRVIDVLKNQYTIPVYHTADYITNFTD